NSAANSLPTAPNSAAGKLGQIVPKPRISFRFSTLREAFWRLKGIFSLLAGKCDGGSHGKGLTPPPPLPLLQGSDRPGRRRGSCLRPGHVHNSSSRAARSCAPRCCGEDEMKALVAVKRVIDYN